VKLAGTAQELGEMVGHGVRAGSPQVGCKWLRAQVALASDSGSAIGWLRGLVRCVPCPIAIGVHRVTSEDDGGCVGLCISKLSAQTTLWWWWMGN
jgi:hypothetical protein